MTDARLSLRAAIKHRSMTGRGAVVVSILTYSTFVYGQTTRQTDHVKAESALAHRQGAIFAVAFDPSGRYVLAAGRRESSLTLGVLRLYDAESGRQLDELPTAERRFSIKNEGPGQERIPFVQPRESYRAVCWSSTGRFLAAKGESGTLDLYELTPAGRLDSVDYVNPGLLAALTRTVGEEAKSSVIAYSPSDRFISEVSTEAIVQWDLRQHRRSVLARFDGALSCVSENGRSAAVVSQHRDVSIWDLKKAVVSRSFALNQMPHAAALSADGEMLACAFTNPAPPNVGETTPSPSTILIYSTQTGIQTAALKGHDDSLISLDFAADAQSVVSGSYDRTIRVWNLRDGSCQVLGPFEREVEAICNGMRRVALIVGRTAIECWDTEQGKKPERLWRREWQSED